ncbi:thioesterase II family protein [Streptomyces corynorhini]|uniref:Thioesterase n=1 Tax=Streptomyces corynorhini TaxID=2282652 RepID=A0A370BBI7_9ACTN|nr:alpha/beta fold hydrolase [Streptomyces corynorhini]RDG36795.1 thioesterase [Streptomyces corynorhini]
MTRVMCLPYAGAGAGVYRPWKTLATGRARAVPVQLPGREEEFSAPCYASFHACVADVTRRVTEAAAGEPFAIFGHSFGGLIAFETARRLYETGGPLPERLIVSGTRSPRHRGYTALSDDGEEAVNTLKRDSLRGFEALDHPELRALLLPTLRADARLLQQYSDYRPQMLDPLPIPLTAVRGVSDTVATAEGVADWKTFTTKEYAEFEMPGGHLYLLDFMPELWRVIEEQL